MGGGGGSYRSCLEIALKLCLIIMPLSQSLLLSIEAICTIIDSYPVTAAFTVLAQS